MGMQSMYRQCAGLEIHYTHWQPEGPVRGQVLAWHGLARTGRDMDDLAQHLCAQGWQVVCPDTVGRGLSQWSPQPEHHYQLAFYAQLAAELVDALGWSRFHWVGTSMGGAIGMVAASPLGPVALQARIQSLLLNDMAPELEQVAIDRIRSYAGQPPAFDTVSALEAYLRQVYAPYGWLSDAQWRRMTETSVRRLPNGQVTVHYDPRMVMQFTEHPDDYRIWQHYDALRCPVLLLRGEHSDLVRRETVERMRQRGPGAQGRLQTREVAGCGHAPALNVPAHWQWVEAFLNAV